MCLFLSVKNTLAPDQLHSTDRQPYIKEHIRPQSWLIQDCWSDSRLLSHVAVSLMKSHRGRRDLSLGVLGSGYGNSTHILPGLLLPVSHLHSERSQPQGGEQGFPQLAAATHTHIRSPEQYLPEQCQDWKKNTIPTHIRNLIKADQLINCLLSC